MSDTRIADVLKEKAMLLIRREREVFQFRQDRARTETWLDVFHTLSLRLNSTDHGEVVQKWAALLIERLGYQMAGVYHRDRDGNDASRNVFSLEWGEPQGRLIQTLQLSNAAFDYLKLHDSGRCESSIQPAEGVRNPLIDELKLDKFYWVYLPTNVRDFLLVAGFSSDAAGFHALNDTDEGHFLMFSNHLGALLTNIWLLGSLVKEQSGLRRSNQELDKSLSALKIAQRQLVQVSRMAGMAEVATGVLHNVGNILTSVSVSSEVISRRVKELSLGQLRKVLTLLDDHGANLPAFFGGDRGAKLLPFLHVLADTLDGEQREIATENELLHKRIEHIKIVIAKQQEHARPMAVIEKCSVRDLIAEGLSLVEAGYSKQQIELVFEHGKLPEVEVDRHQILQILVNLLTNARDAVAASGHDSKTVRVTASCTDDQLLIRVSDNGVGIEKENLAKIFIHGFTTKKTGHGFGLHNASLAAKSMGGELTCFSEGLKHGAVFVLKVPQQLKRDEAPT